MINAQQLRSFLDSQNISPLTGDMMADGEYSLPARDWVLDTFPAALSALQRALDVQNWTSESNDCDDFSRLCAALAQVLHNRTRSGRSALGAGEFWYTRDSGGAHAINLFIIRQRPSTSETIQPGELSLLFFEPQLRREIHLSQKEIESCNGYRF